MNVKFHRGEWPGQQAVTRRPFVAFARSVAAFTMVEIALCLAVIGFALVAIIGILPAGMSVQKDNREQTIINFDAAFLMDLIRSGAHGQNSLTNYIIAITNIQTLYGTNALADQNAGPISTVTNWFTTNQTYFNGTTYNYSLLTNGFNIVGLLTTPKYLSANNDTQFYSNSVTADFIAFSGNAVDQGRSQTSKDFAFSYRVNVEVNRAADYAYNPKAVESINGADGDWLNFTGPGAGSATVPDFISLVGGHRDSRFLAHNMHFNSYELRLRIRWPILATGKTGGGSLVFRSSAAGDRDTDNSIVPGLTYYHLNPLNFTGRQNKDN